MKLFAALSVALIALSQAAQSAPLAEPPWGEFNWYYRGTVLDGFTIETLNDAPGTVPRHLAKRTDSSAGESADSANCPGLAQQVEILPSLPVPPLRPPISNLVISAEGGFSLDVRSNGYSVMLGVGAGPLADWVQQTIRILEPCWTTE